MAGGVVVVPSQDAHLYAFDAAGTQQCSGSPVVCTPLATFTQPSSMDVGASISNGFLYTVTASGTLTASRVD